MFRPLASLPLQCDLIRLLAKNGFLYVEDVENAPEAASKIIDPELIQKLVKPPKILTALEQWQAELYCDYVKTFNKNLDEVLDGGFQCGTITELCGLRGSGKTQICLQIALSVQLAKEKGGLNGKSLYIDTRNNFSIKRLQDMIKGYQNAYPRLKLDEDEMLGRISVISLGSAEKLCSILAKVKDHLGEVENKSDIRVIIIDSLSLPVICSVDEPLKRTKYYLNILQELQTIAQKHNIAIVTTSELSNQIDSKGKYCVASATGISVAHRVHRRLYLTRVRDTKFAAKILKSTVLPQLIVPFYVNTDGIRDN